MKKLGLAVGLIAIVLAAEAMGSDTMSIRTLEPGQCYTWGINPQKTLALEPNQIVTEAVLTLHNFRSGVGDTGSYPRSSSRTGSSSETPNYDSLRLYVLNNQRYGFLPLNTGTQNGDPFAGVCGALNAEYVQGDLVYRLSGTHDADAWTTEIFGEIVSLELTDGTRVSLSSSLVEFIDYAGTGVSVGFGIWPGEARFYYDDITLTLTVQSYAGDHLLKTIVCRIGDQVLSEKAFTLTVSAVNGSVDVSPNKPTYQNGDIVTLTAVPRNGYLFDRWSGSAAGTANPLTLTIDGHKTVAANFAENSRSSQRGT